jgi:hypothetical protein
MLKNGTKIKSFSLPGNETGIILKYYTDRKGADGADLYDVLDENGDIHIMTSSLFDNFSIENIKNEIEETIDKIIIELDLKKSDDVMEQLKSCCLVQKYIVEHNDYENEIMEEKEKYNPAEIVVLDLYNSVVLHRGVCTSNSLMFKMILRKLDINVEVVGLISNDSGEYHAANIVELDNEYYFFDSTLEKNIYIENYNKTKGQLILCCAGLGKKEYLQFYTPNGILPDNPFDDVRDIPGNIALSRIPAKIVNNLIIESKKIKK